MMEKTQKLPEVYYEYRKRSFLAAGLAVAFAGVAGWAYVNAGENRQDPSELCTHENTACYQYVEEKNEQEKFLLSGLVLVIGSGMALSRASSLYHRAENIREKHEKATLTP